jgi:adenylate cyclase
MLTIRAQTRPRHALVRLRHRETRGKAMIATSNLGPPPPNQEVWRAIFAEGHPQLQSFQRLHKRLPSPPRCKMCFAPFAGLGGIVMRFRGKGRNQRNPGYCDACDKFIHAFPGGAEVELSMIFADVRGSVRIAEEMLPTDFSRIMADFRTAVAAALLATDGFIVDAAGDHVVGVYPPGFSGALHARKAISAAESLLRYTDARFSKPLPIPIGVSVHTGNVFIGTLEAGEAGVQAVGILGDNVNIAARLVEAARAGEALVSEASSIAAQLDDGLESRELLLKGKTMPTRVRVVRHAHP